MAGLLAAQGQEYKQTMGNFPTDSIVNADVLNELKTSGVDTTKIEEKLIKQGYTPPVDYAAEVDKYVLTNQGLMFKNGMDVQTTIANAYKTPGWTEQDVWDLIQSLQ